MQSPLVMFGISLDVSEIFLRWLLLEREKFFRLRGATGKTTYYVYSQEENLDCDEFRGKRFFLEGVGVTLVEVPQYADIYESPAWVS